MRYRSYSHNISVVEAAGLYMHGVNDHELMVEDGVAGVQPDCYLLVGQKAGGAVATAVFLAVGHHGDFDAGALCCQQGLRHRFAGKDVGGHMNRAAGALYRFQYQLQRSRVRRKGNFALADDRPGCRLCRRACKQGGEQARQQVISQWFHLAHSNDYRAASRPANSLAGNGAAPSRLLLANGPGRQAGAGLARMRATSLDE